MMKNTVKTNRRAESERANGGKRVGVFAIGEL
jgi:hypothetical protein